MPLTVLIADDEPIERKVIAKIISDRRLPAVVIGFAESGTEALHQSGALRPDLVFIDIRMPGMTGLDAAAAIKRNRPETFIAIVTAYDEFDYAKRAIDIHADYFLLKPVIPDEVEKIVRECAGETNALFPVPAGSSADISPKRMQLAQETVKLLHRHYAEPISLSWIASKLNVSEKYLSRTFKEAYNTSVMHYLTQIRIERAAEFLKDPNVTVAEVAEKVGFSSASYFGQTFKRLRRMTPLQYQKQAFTSDR